MSTKKTLRQQNSTPIYPNYKQSNDETYLLNIPSFIERQQIFDIINEVNPKLKQKIIKPYTHLDNATFDRKIWTVSWKPILGEDRKKIINKFKEIEKDHPQEFNEFPVIITSDIKNLINQDFVLYAKYDSIPKYPEKDLFFILPDKPRFIIWEKNYATIVFKTKIDENDKLLKRIEMLPDIFTREKPM